MLKKRYATNKKEFEVFYNSLKNKIEYLEKKINNFDRDFIRQQKNEKEKELALQKREIAKAAVNNSVSKDESPIGVPKQIREIVTTQQKEILKILSRVCGLEKIFLEKDFSDLQRYEIFTIRTEMENLDSGDQKVMEIRDKIMKIIKKIYPSVNIF